MIFRLVLLPGINAHVTMQQLSCAWVKEDGSGKQQAKLHTCLSVHCSRHQVSVNSFNN